MCILMPIADAIMSDSSAFASGLFSSVLPCSTSAAGSVLQIEAFISEPAQPTKVNLTAPDTFEYDFRLESVDYILPNRPLSYNNFSTPPAAPPELAAAMKLPLADGFVTWDRQTLEHNKALSRNKANRKIEDAVVTLKEAADIAMQQPIYLVTNKTNILKPFPKQNPQGDPRLYFSLSDFYMPDGVSAVNPEGVPYKYSPSVNTEVRLLHCSAYCSMLVRQRKM
jgi:hypothetical protein